MNELPKNHPLVAGIRAALGDFFKELGLGLDASVYWLEGYFGRKIQLIRQGRNHAFLSLLHRYNHLIFYEFQLGLASPTGLYPAG